MLNTYIQQVQRLLNDPNANLYSTADVTAYINTARGQIAAEGQCIRVLTPSAAGVASVTVNSGGSGYTAPTVTIAASGDARVNSTATATASQSGGVVISITVTASGLGYSTAPVVTITDASGTGATATAVLGYTNQTVLGQEIYPFSAINLSGNVGVASVLAVRGASILWGTFRYTLTNLSFSKYQALVRNYTAQYLDIPGIMAQFGQGLSGSVYVYPLPSDTYPMEWDCLCLPVDLADDTTAEAIPYPWTDCVQYFAAYMAYMQAQRSTDADRMFALYEKFMKRARAFSQPSSVSSWYGRA